ncbi:flagellar assembly protein FliW [Patulibacter defluvii]|uniref:flagellar assembly protein FliW n=1 Tax=Patulibacter defluvii TaxID=3095358 RepID=UPI002A7603B1|nr:flagellar assembly protein FliW [Patulibacter sp. DM4]
MPIAVHSTRLGDVEVPEADVLDFPDGLPGLDGRRWALLRRTADDAFCWLQSLDDPDVALPLTRPERFFPGYALEVEEGELPRELGDPAAAEAWVTVRAGERLADFVANLRAPIVVADGRGWQLINRHPDAALRAPLVAPGGDVAC